MNQYIVLDLRQTKCASIDSWWTQIKHQQTNMYREDYHLILLYNSTVLTSLIILTEDKSRNAQSRNKKNTTLPPQRENYLSACIPTLYLLHKWTLNLLFWNFINFCFTFYWGSVSTLQFFFQLNKLLANVYQLLALPFT